MNGHLQASGPLLFIHYWLLACVGDEEYWVRFLLYCEQDADFRRERGKNYVARTCISRDYMKGLVDEGVDIDGYRCDSRSDCFVDAGVLCSQKMSLVLAGDITGDRCMGRTDLYVKAYGFGDLTERIFKSGEGCVDEVSARIWLEALVNEVDRVLHPISNFLGSLLPGASQGL